MGVAADLTRGTIDLAFDVAPDTKVYNHLNQPRELVKAKAVTE